MLFVIGDYAAGMLIGALTALGVRAAVWPGMDMVLAMLAGMAVGIVLHLILGLLLAPLLSMSIMVTAMVIGMYGGMLFGMRDSMAAGSPTLGRAAGVGALFGAITVLALHVYDRALRRVVVDAED